MMSVWEHGRTFSFINFPGLYVKRIDSFEPRNLVKMQIFGINRADIMLLHGRSKQGVPKVEGELAPDIGSIHNRLRVITDNLPALK